MVRWLRTNQASARTLLHSTAAAYQENNRFAAQRRMATASWADAGQRPGGETPAVVDEWLRARVSVVPAARMMPGDDFAARVMSRVQAQPLEKRALPPSPIADLLAHLRMVTATLGLSALIALISSLVVTVLVPALAVSFVSVLLNTLISLLAIGGMVLSAINQALSNDTLMLTLSAILVSALILYTRLSSRRLAREA